MGERDQAAVNDALQDFLRCTPKARREVLTELRILALCLCDPARLEEQEAFAAAADLIAAIESAAPAAAAAARTQTEEQRT